MGDTELESLTEEECWALLENALYGRVAVVGAGGRPEVFPVNFVLHDRTVVLVTGSSVLRSRAPLGHVAFEVDVVDPSSHEGWDVVVSGEGADITDAVDNRSVTERQDQIVPWAPGEKRYWISIVNPHFTGRRLYRPGTAPSLS